MSNALIIAPHPDDSSLACAGTIVQILQEGGDVRVVNMTDGRNSHFANFGISEDPTPDELAEIRRNEELGSASVLGMPHSNLTFLDFEDGALQTRPVLDADFLRPYFENATERFVETRMF